MLHDGTQDLAPAHNEDETPTPFERIRHTDEQGDFWLARELMPLLEYHKWQDFEDAIKRAIEDCAKSERSVEEHFEVFTRSRKNSQAGGRPQKDYRLTRYACRLVVMASRTTGDVAAQARTYFSDRVEQAEQLDAAELPPTPELAFIVWRERVIRGLLADGYSLEWAQQRVDDIVARNELTHEWSVRGIKDNEYRVLTNRLHMGAFGLSIEEHKGVKNFPVTYQGKRMVYKGDLPPAMTRTELALNSLASSVARDLHELNDSQGFDAITGDVDVAGRIVGDTRRQIEAATGQPVVSPRNMLHEPDGGLWAQLPAPEPHREDE